MALTITYDEHTNDYNLWGGTFTALQFRGALNCYASPLYPKAAQGDFWRVSKGGNVGGESGDVVTEGQYLLAIANAEAGTATEVGVYWEILASSALTTEGTIAEEFALADLSGLPTADPGGGNPWLNGGLMQVGP